MAVLLMGGAMSETWADVTYHILTKPFSTKKRPYVDDPSDTNKLKVDVNAALEDRQTNIRVEAFRYTSSSSTIVLPDAYKSPLAKNFKFYAAG
ncbi:MAG: hypothetical protein IKT13_02200, partial [Paludibacteraceae bacterium]|nr:hypothetical protein [Paludibacteraceae bacterium]